ncbi:MAG TPA: glycosyltransferase family 4 protein [Chitinophagaceae bacterium]|nr:glycosyltransferase family 4 protein [Chitinophagaceae bacterium]
MKKILISAYGCSPVKGSEEHIGWSWAVNVAKKGYHVWCITNFEDKEAILLEKNRLGLANLEFVFVELDRGLDKKLFDPSSKKVYIHYYLWRKKASSVAKELHKKLSFDVVHHVSYGSLQQGTYLWQLKNTKIIFGPVGGGQEALAEFKEYFGPAWKFEVIRTAISKYTLKYSSNLKNTIRYADHILVTNDDTRRMVKETNIPLKNEPVLVLDSAIPDKMLNFEYVARSSEGPLQLLWTGRLLPRKGLKLIFHSLSFLPKDLDYKLTIIGGGEQFHLLDEWIKEYGLDTAKLNIVGQIPYTEVSNYYKQADVFLFCSLRDSHPTQLNEAMAFGIPIITLNIHGSAQVPDACSIKINPTTKEETARKISEAIIKFHKDTEYRKGCAVNAFNYAKTNTWAKKIDLVTDKFYEGN